MTLPAEYEFPGGKIELVTNEQIYNACENKDCFNRPTYYCSWGGGYEYDCAILCKIHLETAVQKLNEIIKDLK